jgi:predicted permease
MNTQPVAWSLRLFRALAAAYPHEFRNVYGDDMEQMAEDAVEAVWRLRGVPGLFRLLSDVALRIPVEYAGEIRQDVRYGLRMLRASPGFTAVALVSLTLGIGVATAAFSEMNGFVLRDVPGVARPDELVAVKSPVNYESFRRFRGHEDLFSGTMTYFAPVAFELSFGGRPERVWGNLASPGHFETLGVAPAFGRFFGPNDRDGVVVVSYRLWKDRLGSDARAVGRTLRVNGRPCTLIGVASEDFRGASPMAYAADAWMPLTVDPATVPEVADNLLERRDRKVFHVVARLRAGVTPARAEAALDPIARQMEDEENAPNRDRKGRRVVLAQGGKLMPFEKKDVLPLAGFFIILGGLILLIACANVANMMLARAVGRRKEMAMRLALGAGRARLVRQLLIESLLLAVAAGGIGLLMAEWLMRMASQIRLPYPTPITYDLTPDGRVVVFCVGLTFVSALAFGLAPALRATRVDLTPALKESGSVGVFRGRRFNVRNALMTAQMAASLSLLLITGFLVIGHRRMTGPDVGFDPSGLSMISFDPIRAGYSPERSADFFERLSERVNRLPAVSSASLADAVPVTMIGKPAAPYVAEGDAAKTVRSARRYAVAQEFFATMGIPIIRGRGFRKTDEADDSLAAIVSEKLAREGWPGQDPVGRRIEIGADDLPEFRIGAVGTASRTGAGRNRTFEIIGVARDIRDGLVVNKKDAPSLLYLPLKPVDYARPPSAGMTLVVRARPGADAMTAVRREVAAMDDRLAPFNETTVAESIEVIMSAVRAATWTYTFIGLFGLILASVGLGGVTAYTVMQRRREIGIRVAIGARRIDVLRLVMSEGLTLVSFGAVLGLLGARAGIRAMSWFTAEISRTAGNSTSDPALLAGAPLLLAAVALAACYLPARESTRIDPVEALRQE